MVCYRFGVGLGQRTKGGGRCGTVPCRKGDNGGGRRREQIRHMHLPMDVHIHLAVFLPRSGTARVHGTVHGMVNHGRQTTTHTVFNLLDCSSPVARGDAYKALAPWVDYFFMVSLFSTHALKSATLTLTLCPKICKCNPKPLP